jgi:hypothetical protein
MAGKSLRVSVLLLFAVSGAGAEEVVLKLAPPEGEVYRVHSESVQKMVQSVESVEMQIEQRLSIHYTFTVRQATPRGEVILDVSHQAVAVALDGLSSSLRWDSNEGSTPDHPLARGLAALLDRDYSVVLDTRGRVIEIRGLDGLVEGMMRRAVPEDEKERESIRERLRGIAGERAQREMLNQLFHVYPPAPVRIGESWTIEDSSLILPLKRNGNWVLRELLPDEAVIGMNASLESPEGGIVRQAGPGTMLMELAGTQSGTVRLARDTGWITHRSIVVILAGSYTIEQGPEALTGEWMPVELEATVTWQPY